MEGFHDKLTKYVELEDSANANRLLMEELGNILVKAKSDFVDLLNESGIRATTEMSDTELVKLFLDNVSRNRKLILGSALLTNIHNKSIRFDGEEEVSDCGVKQAYNVMQDYFDDLKYDDFSNEEYANLAADPISAIAQTVGEGLKLGSGAISARDKKLDRRNQYEKAGLDSFSKKQDAKNQLTKSILDQRKAQIAATQKKIDANKKIQKIVIISGAVIVGLGLIAFAIYELKQRKK